MTETLFPLGRHVHHDPRSRSFAAPETPDSALLVSKKHERHIPVFNQGNLGSCTGNAGVGCLGTGVFYNTFSMSSQTILTEDLAISVYSEATEIDTFPGSYPPEDTGSDGLSVAKVLTKRQYISGYQHAFSLNAVLTALQTVPVIVGTNWYDSMFTPQSDGRLTISGNVVGGHEYVLDEIDVENSRVGMTNSWSVNWGLTGRAYILISDLMRLLAEDGDVTIFTPITKPAPTPTPPPTPPTADQIDKNLWISLDNWANARHIGSNKAAANLVKAWADARGLR